MTGITAIRNFLIPGFHNKPVIADLVRPGSSGKFPVVIFSHGFKGFKDWGPFPEAARQFARAGFIFISINYAYNGTTPGSPEIISDLEAFGNNNFSKELDDLEATLTWVEDNALKIGADLGRLSLLGHSRGGAMSVLKSASDNRIQKVAAWASAAGFEKFITRAQIIEWKKNGVHYVENSRTGQMMPLYLQLYYDFVSNHRKLNISKTIAQIKRPLLLVHAKDDETIPYEDILSPIRRNPGYIKLITTRSGGHTFGTAHPFEDTNLPPLFQYIVNQTIDFFGRK